MTPFNIVNNGDFSVQYFFALSGFMITRKIYIYNEKKLSSPIDTYRKLLKITIPSIMLAYVLMSCGMMFHLELPSTANVFPEALSYNNFSPNLFNALLEANVLVFVSSSKYVSPLWTIKVELIGTIFVATMAFYSCSLNNTGKKKLYYIIAGLVFLPLHYYVSTFFWGALMFDCLYNLDRDITVPGKIIRFIFEYKYNRIVFLLFAAYLACINPSCTGIWSIFRSIKKANVIIRGIGVTGLLGLIPYSTLIKKVLSKDILLRIGRLSPYIYAFHWPIILSLGCFSYINIYKLYPRYAAFTVSIICLVATIMFASLYAFLENKISGLLIKRIRRKR